MSSTKKKIIWFYRMYNEENNSVKGDEIKR